jgi:hypothetical protein
MSRTGPRRGVGLLRVLSVANVGSSRSVDSSQQSSSCNDGSSLEHESAASPPSPTTTLLQPSMVHVAHPQKPRKLKSILRKPQEEFSAAETEPGVEGNAEDTASPLDSTTTAPSSPRRQRRRQHRRHRHANKGTRRRMHHHVGFGSVEVREYARTVGDNPSVSAGPPISYVPVSSTNKRNR